MLIADDPAAFFALLQPDDARARHCRAAARTVPGLDIREWPNLLPNLEMSAIEYTGTHAPAAPVSAIRKLLQETTALHRALNQHLLELAKALASTPRSDADRYDQLRAAFAFLVEATLPGLAMPDWCPDSTFEFPHAGEFARIADRVDAAVEALGIALLTPVTRPREAAFDRLIARLALIFEEVTSKPATASRKSSDPTYRPPFARFVAAFWPAASREATPTTKAIAAALAVRWSYALPIKFDRNWGDSHGEGEAA